MTALSKCRLEVYTLGQFSEDGQTTMGKAGPNQKPLAASHPLTTNRPKRKLPSTMPFHLSAPLRGEFIELAPRLGEPVDLLLQELPLERGLALLLEQPGILVLFLQDLHHGFLQVIAILLEHEILDYEWDLVGEPLAGLLEEAMRRVSWGGLAPRPVAAERSLGILDARRATLVSPGAPVHLPLVFSIKL